MKIGMVSKFPAAQDGIAIYADKLCNEMPCEVIRIGDNTSTDADYLTDFTSLSLKHALQRIVEKEKLDLLHVQYIAAGEYFGKYTLNIPLLLALSQRVPVVVTLHEVQYGCTTLRQRVLCLLEGQVVSRAAAVITHTPHQRDAINRKYNTGKAISVPMGVTLKKTAPKNNRNILFFGMLGRGKGVEHLIAAMRMLPDYKLHIAGKIVDKAYVREITAEAGKLSNVTIDAGWVNEKEKERCFMKSSIAVLPYIWAPYQSAVATDAISYGLPIVVTKVGGTWELVSAFSAGEVIEPGNSGAIAAAVKKISAGYTHYRKEVESYRKAANWKTVSRKHATLYGKLVKNGDAVRQKPF